MRSPSISLLAGTALATLASHAAFAEPVRTTVSPYIEVQQVLDVPLKGGGETLTYTALVAGVDASVDTKRAQGTLSYRYERRISESGGYGDEDIHTGVARGELQLVPNLLTLDGGALATRARSDIRGAAPQVLLANSDNVTQVYSLYAGPNLATTAGPLTVTASYHIGYTKVEDRPGGIALLPGQPRLDSFDSSTAHLATASVGMPSGELPFGWTVSGGYEREDASQLDQRYQAKFVRGDVTLPIDPTLALTAGVGYEDIRASQRAPLRNPDGSIVINSRGRFVTDRSQPRQLAYETDGLIYDGGVIWRPNARTTLIAKIGKRYGGTFYSGSLDWRINPYSGVQVMVYSELDSFGRGLTRGIGSLPTQLDVARNPFANNFGGGCIFGTVPGTGGCLDSSLQSVNTANYRSHGVYAIYSARRGPWDFSVGGGYAQRHYVAPVEGNFFSIDGVKDESWVANANLGRKLTPVSGIDLNAYANIYKSGIANAGKVTGEGATGSYYHSFGRLSANAAVGVYAYDQEGFDSYVSGQLLLGMRYQF